ncbi:MAG: hypothetical protein HY675_11630 [Chloroflexi bacterium]|nr:hypothetical protein [Chloroflexota bacterium]
MTRVAAILFVMAILLAATCEAPAALTRWNIRVTAPLLDPGVPAAVMALDAEAPRPDLPADVLIVTGAEAESNANTNLRRIAEFYGLTWTRLSVSDKALFETDFKDKSDQPYTAVQIDFPVLRGLSEPQLAALRTVLEKFPINLLVTGVTSEHDSLATLTGGAIRGSRKPTDSSTDYNISARFPDIARQLAGQRIENRAPQPDSALVATSSNPKVEVVVSATDDTGASYPVFVRYRAGMGSIFVQSYAPTQNLDAIPMWDLYYSFRSGDGKTLMMRYFPEIVPTMMFTRYAAGDRAWHSDAHYANLTIDDPPLQQPFWAEKWTASFYTDLLREMQASNFHTTIAFVPSNYLSSKPDVAKLFREHPERFSLAIHGNNHACPEFPPDASDADREATAGQALSRMERHLSLTGVGYGRIMIFPCEEFDLRALATVKKFNFNLAVSTSNAPRNAKPSKSRTFRMYQADLDYGNFPITHRGQVTQTVYPVDLFLDKPVLLFEHSTFFKDAPGSFGPWADRINQVQGGVEWRSLDYIAKRLYLKKTNRDGTVDVKFYGNNVVLRNDSQTANLFHLSKPETLNVSIRNVTIDGAPVAYRVENGVLRLDVYIPERVQVEVAINYS